MKWEKVRLEDCCYSISDGDHQPPPKAQQGIPFVTISNINSMNQLDFSDTMFVPKEYYQSLDEKRKVRKGDVLYSVVGSFGIPVLIKEERPFVFQRHIAILRPKEDIVDSGFLFYTMLNRDFYAKADAVAIGAAQRTVSLGSLRNIKIDVPSLESQKHIADILSAYDDLIENNQKQIKLLEEAAQRLYKEWFVDLRFPGHENTKIVDGVPEGWKKNCAEKFFEITIGKTPPRTEKRCFTTGKNGIPWVSIADMGNSGMFVLNTAENLTDDAIKQYNVKVIPKNTVLLSFKLTVGRVAIAPNDICTNEAIAHFKGRRECEREYTYFYLKNFHYDELGSTSSISKAVNSKIIKAMPFIMPSEKLLKEYSSKTKDVFDLIICKQKMDNNLKIARDRILHKLMSGEVEV